MKGKPKIWKPFLKIEETKQAKGLDMKPPPNATENVSGAPGEVKKSSSWQNWRRKTVTVTDDQETITDRFYNNENPTKKSLKKKKGKVK